MSLEIATRIAQLIPSDSVDEIKRLLSPYEFEQRKFIISIDISGSSIFFYAVLHCSSSVVIYFLDECGADPNSYGIEQCEKRTCLSIAVSLDSKVMVEILLRRGANINHVSFGHKSALATACFMNNLEMTKFLVENGANISTQDINGKESLLPSGSDYYLVEYLIENGANINMMNEYGDTLLMQAIMMDDMKTVDFLLCCEGLNVRIKNYYNQDALNLALNFDSDDELISEIIERGNYTTDELICLYNWESYLEYALRRHFRSNVFWRKSLELRRRFLDTPIFDDLIPKWKSNNYTRLFNEHDRQFLMYIRLIYGPEHMLTLRITAIVLRFVNTRQNFLEIYEPLCKNLESLHCKNFLQIYPSIENLFRKYISLFSQEADSLEEFFKILSNYTIIFYSKHQQPMIPTTRKFYDIITEEFLEYLINLIPFLINNYRNSIRIIIPKIKKIIKIHLKYSTCMSLARICLRRGMLCVLGIFLPCGDVNKTDENNETILHYLLDSNISHKRRLIKLVVDAGFDFSRVTSTKYCLPCRMKKEGFHFYPEECNTLQCLAANVICQKTVPMLINVHPNLRTIIKTHMHIP